MVCILVHWVFVLLTDLRCIGASHYVCEREKQTDRDREKQRETETDREAEKETGSTYTTYPQYIHLPPLGIDKGN